MLSACDSHLLSLPFLIFTTFLKNISLKLNTMITKLRWVQVLITEANIDVGTCNDPVNTVSLIPHSWECDIRSGTSFAAVVGDPLNSLVEEEYGTHTHCCLCFLWYYTFLTLWAGLLTCQARKVRPTHTKLIIIHEHLLLAEVLK